MSRLTKIVLILLGEGKKDVGNVNHGFDEEPLPELPECLADETSWKYFKLNLTYFTSVLP